MEGDGIPAGDTSYDPSKVVHYILYDTEKESQILGFNHRKLHETTRDMLDAFRSKGWL